jgi:hypothetical protein
MAVEGKRALSLFSPAGRGTKRPAFAEATPKAFASWLARLGVPREDGGNFFFSSAV